MNFIRAISLAVVLAASLAAVAQKGGGHGGGAARVGNGHARMSTAPTANNEVSGRVIAAPTGGFRGSYASHGNTYAPSHFLTGSYRDGWGLQYENWSGNSYVVSHPSFKGSFNFSGDHDAMRKSYDRDHAKLGEPHVNHVYGNGWGSWGNQLRYGYFGWPGWRDSSFYFSNWEFSPYGDPCAISPFYSYPWLPPYISESTVTVRPGINFNWGGGSPYQYHPAFDNFGYGNPALNCSIGQICSIYGRNPVDAISYVIPSDQSIGIFSGGRYMYSLTGPDFTKILIDSAHSSYTIGFGINFVREIGDNAVVNCTQTCKLPEGGEATYFQNYELCKVKGKYVVTGFMSSAKS